MAASRQVVRFSLTNSRFLGYFFTKNYDHIVGHAHKCVPSTFAAISRQILTMPWDKGCNTHKFSVGQSSDDSRTATKKDSLITNQPQTSTRTVRRAFSTRADTQPCWNCGREIHRIEEQHFCKCGMIQPPMADKNHFEVMDIKEEFDINLNDLMHKFRDLQRKLHPDKFSMKSEKEQEFAREQSSRVNQAYKILQKPLSRGLYILELHGCPIEEGETQIDSSFLMDIMEINEQISESSSVPQLERIRKEARENIDALVTEVSKALRHSDFEATKSSISKMKYHVNIEDKAEMAIENLQRN